MDAAGRGRGAGGELALRRALQKRRRSESAAQGFHRSQRPRSAYGRRLHARSRLARRWRDADLSAQHGFDQAPARPRARDADLSRAAVDRRTIDRRKIGRTSCGEKVCKYVEISVVACTIKKKTK